MGCRDLCRWVGRKMVDLCARTGRVVNLFLAACQAAGSADRREVLRQRICSGSADGRAVLWPSVLRQAGSDG